MRTLRSRFSPVLAVLPVALALAGGCARGNQEGNGIDPLGGGGEGTGTSTSTSTSTSTGVGTGAGAGASTSTGAGSGPAVINEVVYDPPGVDVGCFIEILGPPGMSLAGWSVEAVNGSDGMATEVAALDGHAIGAGGYFVIAQDASVAVPAGATKMIAAMADLQNGPDSVRLKQGGAVVDALGYGSFKQGQFFAGEGSPAVTSSSSLCRIPNGADSSDNSADFKVCSPTPGAANAAGP